MPILTTSGLGQHSFRTEFLRSALLPKEEFCRGVIFLFPHGRDVFSVERELPFGQLHTSFHFANRRALYYHFRHGLANFLHHTSGYRAGTAFRLLEVSASATSHVSSRRSFAERLGPSFLSEIMSREAILIASLGMSEGRVQTINGESGTVHLGIRGRAVNFSQDTRAINYRGLSIGRHFHLWHSNFVFPNVGSRRQATTFLSGQAGREYPFFPYLDSSRLLVAVGASFITIKGGHCVYYEQNRVSQDVVEDSGSRQPFVRSKL